MAESKIVLLSFEWTSKAAVVSFRAAPTSCHPLRQLPEQSYLFYRVSYGSFHVWISSHLVLAELLNYMLYMQNFIPNTSAKPLPASNFHTALGLQGRHLAPVAVWPASHSSNLSPQITLWLVGHSLGHCSLVLRGWVNPLDATSWWVQKNWNILKKKQGKKEIHMEELNNKQLQQECLISCNCEVPQFWSTWLWIEGAYSYLRVGLGLFFFLIL